MDKTKIATALGAATAAALAMLPLDAGAATPPAGVFQPIPNATSGDARPIQAYWRHHRWRSHYGYGYYGYRRPYGWHRHHHHHRYFYERHWY